MNKESFRKLGIILNENIPTQELLAEDFNGEYYGLTKRQTEKIRALRDIVTEFLLRGRNEYKIPIFDFSAIVNQILNQTKIFVMY